MIIGLGVDLVNIPRLAESLESPAFLTKVFTPAEIAICQRYKSTEEHFAGKFAVKEAFMKAVNRGIYQEVWFRNIEVLNRESGEPYLNLSGEAERAFALSGATRVHTTLSHTAGFSVAVVILECEG